MQLIFVDEFLCVRGNCEYKKMVLPDFTDGDFERLNGVIFLDDQGLLYGSCWDEREISENLLAEKEEKKEESFLEQEAFAGEESVAGEKKANEEILVKEEKNGEEIRMEEVTAQEELPVEETAETMLSQFPQLIWMESYRLWKSE